jgi:hypothetical protein
VTDRAKTTWTLHITRIPMAHGRVGTVAVLDWQSGRGLSRLVAITMEYDLWVEARAAAVAVNSRRNLRYRRLRRLSERQPACLQMRVVGADSPAHAVWRFRWDIARCRTVARS